MAFFGIFGKRVPKTEVLAKDPEIDEEKLLLRESQREKNAIMRQRMQIELQNMRLEAQRKQQELQEDIEDQREERRIRRLERMARRQELEAELFGDDDDEEDIKEASPESMLFGFLNNVMKKQSPSIRSSHSFAIDVPAQIETPSPVMEREPTPATFSPEKINEIWSNLPPSHKAIAQQMSDDDLKTYIISQIPNIDQQSLNTAIATVRGKA